MYVDKLFTQKVRTSLNEPVYQGFQQPDVNAYFSSLKRLFLGPLVTVGLTAGIGALWSYFSSQPSSMMQGLKRFTNVRGSGFSSTPYGTRGKAVKAGSFDKFEEKAGIFQTHTKQTKWEGQIDATQDPRSMRHHSHHFDKSRARGEGQLRRELQAIGFLKTRSATQALEGEELKRAISRRDMERASIQNLVQKNLSRLITPPHLEESKQSPAKRVRKSRVFGWFYNRIMKRKAQQRIFSRVWIAVPTFVVFTIFCYQHLALSIGLYLKYAAYIDTYYLLKESDKVKQSEENAKQFENEIERKKQQMSEKSGRNELDQYRKS